VDAAGRVLKLFDELIGEGDGIKQSCKKMYFAGQKKAVSQEAFTAWKTKCLSLLKSTFGSSSPQYDSFVNTKFFDYYNTTQVYLGIMKAARADIRKGYFFHKDLMLSVNIYDSLLARARDQIQSNRLGAAQAILEVVLEEVLAKICQNKKIPYEQDDTAGTLAGTLVKTETISQSVYGELVNLEQTLQRARVDTEELTTATNWILAFLNKYLGGQILILN
jgi:hypothetical protein